MTDSVKTVAWMWQHPETGWTGFVEDAPQSDLDHWTRVNRPRQIIGALVLRSDLESLESRLQQVSKENDFLRALTGNSDKACVYCGLGADEQGKCASGFPGCARGDDQMLCREVGVGMERDELKARLQQAEQALRAAARAIAGESLEQ